MFKQTTLLELLYKKGNIQIGSMRSPIMISWLDFFVAFHSTIAGLVNYPAGRMKMEKNIEIEK